MQLQSKAAELSIFSVELQKY